MSNSIALYLHIPFCRRKCRYCSFVSYERRQADIPAYLRALKAELAQRSRGEQVSAIYFGGGTPTLLSPEHLGNILKTIHSLFDVEEAAEITTEANPGTIDETYLSAIRELGVNRLSLGVQSLNDKELALLGRIHTASEARQAARFARSAGFENLNLDLIYGLPGQSLAVWQQTLEEAVSLSPEHLSLYALTLEEGTPMKQAIDNGILPEIDPDRAAAQYELAEDLLTDRGYRHYEISNWAKPGRECRHNLTYWHNRHYLGVGVAAHSWLDGRRLANTDSIDKYLAEFAKSKGQRAERRESFALHSSLEMAEEIPPELELAETIILGLRLDEGVSVSDIQSRFGINPLSHYHRQIDEMTIAGLLECSGDNLRLTRRGRLLSNEVFWRLLPAGVSASPVGVG